MTVQRGKVGNHRAQGIVEQFNRTQSEKLFSHQYTQEITNKDARSKEWVKKLPRIIKVLNDGETRLIGLKPKDAIKAKSVKQNPAAPAHRLGEKRENKIAGEAPGDTENDTRRWATDPIWSIKSYIIKNVIVVENQPVLYYLEKENYKFPAIATCSYHLKIFNDYSGNL